MANSWTAGRGPVAGLAVLILLSGCQNKEQAGGTIGASVATVACGALGHALFDSTLGTVLPAAACGAAGYFIGSAIGQQLDEADRQQAWSATEQALAAPVAYPKGSTAVTTTSAAAPKKAPKPPKKAAVWKSDSGTGNHGSAKVTAVQPQADGGECRVVHEVAYIKGQEVTQDQRYCRGTEGEWVAQA
ncbi:MAG: hypothetical protein U1E45_20295 [Geminicoccaceae bacterium]